MSDGTALDDAVLRALQAQRSEYESDFETTNEPLQWLIDQVEPGERLEIGRTLLADAEPQKRILGVRILRETWDRRPEALSLVLGAVQHEAEEDVLGWLLSAVAFLGDSSGLAIVEGFVHHPDTRVRDQAAGAISRCGADGRSSSAVAALVELSDDPQEEVRFSAVYELGQWWQDGDRDSRIERRLRRAMDEDDGRVRGIAADAFATPEPPPG